MSATYLVTREPGVAPELEVEQALATLLGARVFADGSWEWATSGVAAQIWIGGDYEPDDGSAPWPLALEALVNTSGTADSEADLDRFVGFLRATAAACGGDVYIADGPVPAPL